MPLAPSFDIVEGRGYHCGMILRRMRIEEHAGLLAIGVDRRASHWELRDCFQQSYFRRAWLINGELAGLGGLVGTQMSTLASVWLVLSDVARRYPLATVKEARRQLDEIMLTKHELVTTIVPGDEAALRFAVFLGFEISSGGLGARAYSRAGRRTLTHYIASDSACRVALGKHNLIAMGYRGSS